MKPMIWHPEEKDDKVNQYLDHMNREPWLAMIAGLFAVVMLFCIMIFMGLF